MTHNLVAVPQMLLVTEQGVAPPPTAEARHGVTPPMRDARTRHFRPRPDVSPALVAKTEQDLLAILGVRTGRGTIHVAVSGRH